MFTSPPAATTQIVCLFLKVVPFKPNLLTSLKKALEVDGIKVAEITMKKSGTRHRTRMTNEIGKAMFSKAGELGVLVAFMCMKVLHF